MKGWVYIITNKSMPGILKVGFSLKDPTMRAKELDNTGNPHPYTVEYEVLIEEPRNIEQAAHQKLSKSNENKEWFNCSISEAIDAIRASSNNIILENIYNSDINAIALRKEYQQPLQPDISNEVKKEEVDFVKLPLSNESEDNVNYVSTSIVKSSVYCPTCQAKNISTRSTFSVICRKCGSTIIINHK